MRRLLAGITFLSRIPVPGAATFDAADVGRATSTFPVVGALLGRVLVLLRHGLYRLRGGVALAGVAAVSALQGAWGLKKLGGITGDTMGANTEACEVRVFVVLLGGGVG
jgi:cobalamin synthase